MESRILFATILVMVVATTTSQGVDDGKYRPSQQVKKGQYVHVEDGKYVDNAAKWRYVHVHDQREKGKYIHVHIPYDGGYGPYSHIDNPYKHVDNPYVHDYEPLGEYSQLDPFGTDFYYIDRPDVYQEYGFPHHDPFTTNSNEKDSKISTGNLKTTVDPAATETILITSTESSSKGTFNNQQDKILQASTNSGGQIDPFGTNVYHIEKPKISQEYGFPNHDPKTLLENFKTTSGSSVANLKTSPTEIDINSRHNGSSSTIESLNSNRKESQSGSSKTLPSRFEIDSRLRGTSSTFGSLNTNDRDSQSESTKNLNTASSSHKASISRVETDSRLKGSSSTIESLNKKESQSERPTNLNTAAGNSKTASSIVKGSTIETLILKNRDSSESLKNSNSDDIDPFRSNFFNIEKPKIPQEYGFPNHDPHSDVKIVGRSTPSAKEIIFAASSTERLPPKRNVEIVREGRSKIPRNNEQEKNSEKS